MLCVCRLQETVFFALVRGIEFSNKNWMLFGVSVFAGVIGRVSRVDFKNAIMGQ